MLGLIGSRESPGHVLLDTLDCVPEWVKAGRVIVSGFHSPLDQQALRSMLRCKGLVVKVLARGMTNYCPATEEREPLAAGRMLIISALVVEPPNHSWFIGVHLGLVFANLIQIFFGFFYCYA